MATWTVEQKVEVWYSTTVEADSMDEAIRVADGEGEWEAMAHGHQEWCDEYCLTNEDTNEQYSVINGITYAE
jgi:hypothetical protein